MSDNPRLPLKFVPQLEPDFYKPDGRGGEKKIFGDFTSSMRSQLAGEVIAIRDHFRERFDEFPDVPAVARARLKPKAIAKSHRPSAVLSNNSCPIIGAEGLGQLLISVTPEGLERLARRIERDTTNIGLANLSTFESFSPYTVEHEPIEGDTAKVKLFRHHLTSYDTALDNRFYEVVRRFGIKEPHEVRYGRGLKIFRLAVKRKEVLEELTRFVGTQSVGPFPVYLPVRSASTPVRGAVSEDFPKPVPGFDYPLVGVVDSGTSESDPYLKPWRHGRETYVSANDQDYSHGTFVSGLLIHARKLNHDDQRFPLCSVRIVDVVALGATGTSEDKLLSSLEDALSKFPEVKVWNLSLGTDSPIDNQKFSDLSVALDRLQDEYETTFVLAAGNYTKPPFRGWPPDKGIGEADRICAPADSVRSLVVGSVAHRDHSSSRVKAGQPSPFSRRGPGPLYLPKPELSHIGGNCDKHGKCSQIGVLSIDSNMNVAEDFGTSFATPLVSTLLANVGASVKGDASNLLSRALLVHSAAMHGKKLLGKELGYGGFGIPADITTILGCEPWQCTMIFELAFGSNVAYQKATFPMPKSLYVGVDRVRANFLITLVHEADLDASYGSEYCRTNMAVSLGTYELRGDGKYHHSKRIPEDPQLKGKNYEKDLVQYGFKWSPVKVYRRDIPKGIQGRHWRLDISLENRHGHVSTGAQRAALVITIADPAKRAPVYDEMVVQMNNLGWAATDLQVRPRLRP